MGQSGPDAPVVDRGLTQPGGLLTPELRELVDRVASVPHGLALIHQACPETMAVMLGMDARIVDQARAMLETPEGRARLIEEVRAARSRAPIAWARPAPFPAQSRPAETVDEVIRRAEQQPLGLRFLTDVPLETVAIALQAHAFLVAQARDKVTQARGEEDVRSGNDD